MLFGSCEKKKTSDIAEPRWPAFEKLTKFQSDVRSLADFVDLKGCTICPQSFVVIALTFSVLRRDGLHPVPEGPKNPGLNSVNETVLIIISCIFHLNHDAVVLIP